MARKLVKCSACGHANEVSFAYCRNCGTLFGTQLPPKKSKWRSRWDVRPHPDLYATPRQASRFDLRNMLRLFYSPKKALKALYISASLRSAIVLVVVSGSLIWLLGTPLTQSGVIDQAIYFVGGITKYCLFIVIIGVVASYVSKLLNRKGNVAATITLIGYCQPFMASLVAVYWTTVFFNFPLLISAIFEITAILYFFGLTAAAISYANDLSAGESALLLMLGAFAQAGLFKAAAIALKAVGVDFGFSFIPLSF
jgi:hypothetical protein